MTPSELLANAPVHSIGETALILGFRRKDGTPYREPVRELVRSGGLRLVDPEQPVTRWCVSTVEIERYIREGRRKGADVIPIREGVA